MPSFNHLHVHTQFSLLDGAADISKLYKKAMADNMRGIAITDHGNMFGVFQFVAEAQKHADIKYNDDGTRTITYNKIKPIVGCEFYMVDDRNRRQFTKGEKDVRYHQLFLAKNEEGYRNLVKLCSLGYIEGMYGKYPRIDKELVLKYHKGLIATTCCLGAIVPRTIIKKGEEAAEAEFKWWLDIFGEDYYIELQRHKIGAQDKVNEVLLRFAEKHNVKVIASNDSHYVDQADYNAHDILLCVNTGEKQSTPSTRDFSDEEEIPRGTRFAFANDQFYFKTQDEMLQTFSDLPQAIDNTNEIVDKVEALDLVRNILLPNFPVPPPFTSQFEYLENLTFSGAQHRYQVLTPEIDERIRFELSVIEKMGFAGYFLIVADFIKAGRDIGVFVGPGRGSAAGSVVAYCIGITNIDPIKYDLLFERFLNPDRKSMPDIDTDFDDEGRQKVIDYVVEKYGRNQVAQIVTYGTMAAKTSIQDVSRVLDYPIQDMNTLKKFVPDRASLNRSLYAPIEGDGGLKDKEGLSSDELALIKELREIAAGTDVRANILREASVLEGSVRNTGVHAAGIIIAPTDLTELIPVALAKDSDLLLTQFEGTVIESAGVIKMDFLGLKTLTIIRDALKMIRENHGVEIDIDTIPLDDAKTLELYQRAETNGTFQFESVGMQKYLRDLKADKFEDLIAMNALYRPGPLEYIPNFISRKHGREPITYDLPVMEEYLKDTYGITVYQEQVMLLSQKIAGFTKGDADVLRKAMGKKDRKTLDKMKSKFIEGAAALGHPADKLEKIWTDWEAFAQYAFNKSHSTCYAFVAFQTGYLKSHYPAEYMASVLNHVGSIEKITFFMEECRRMGIPVLGPDINESNLFFSPNSKGEIRFGLGAIKGVGEAAVDAIVAERKAAGPYLSIFDLVKRINLRAANKKAMESLALGGAFDCFTDVNRAQYFVSEPGSEMIFLEKALRWGASYQAQKESTVVSLFGDAEDGEIPEPQVPHAERWHRMLELNKEKEVTGFYISGHPLDEYKFEIKYFCKNKLGQLKELKDLNNQGVSFAGVVTDVQHKIAKNGQGYGSFKIEDFNDAFEFPLFKEDYLKFKHFFEIGAFLYVTGRVQQRFNQEQYEVKVNKVELLTELRQNRIKSVLFNIKLSGLDDVLLKTLGDTIRHNPGEVGIKFRIHDTEGKYQVEMPSREVKIELSNRFIDTIDNLRDVKMEIVRD